MIQLVSVAEQGGVCLTLSQTPKICILASMPKMSSVVCRLLAPFKRLCSKHCVPRLDWSQSYQTFFHAQLS